jgi:hypothetical protein
MLDRDLPTGQIIIKYRVSSGKNNQTSGDQRQEASDQYPATR